MSSASEGRYGAIERAYGEGRFSDALERAKALLTELQGPEATAESQAVLGRLQLLTGHIHLYGLGQPDEARASTKPWPTAPHPQPWWSSPKPD